ncbi:MAG: glycosyltransferase [Acidimicrobiia bacterium]
MTDRDRLRILIAHSSYRLKGGEDRYVQQQSQLLQTVHSVELYQKDNTDLSSLHAATAMFYDPRVKSELARTVHAFSPQVIHLHNAYPSLGPAVHQVARRQGVPLLMTVHNYRLRCPNAFMFTEGSNCNRCEGGRYLNALTHNCFTSRTQAAGYVAGLWTHRFVLGLEEKVALFLCPSRFIANKLLKWGFPEEKVLVVPNFTEGPISVSNAPGTYGAYLGRLSPEKGLDVLVQALAIAGDPPFRIVGDGPSSASLQATAKQLGLRNLKFMGRVEPDEVNELLNEIRFLAMPSVWNENAPLAALEAMAHARPLVLSNVGGLTELAADGAGITIEPGDPNALAGGIQDLMDDDGRCRELGGTARRLWEQKFNPQVHRSELEAAYRTAIERAA